MVTRLTTLARVSQYAPNPMSNLSLRSDPMPSMGLPNLGSQFLPPTSHAVRGPYVPILQNVPIHTPPAIEFGGPDGYVHVSPTSQPPAYAWVPPQQPNIGN